MDALPQLTGHCKEIFPLRAGGYLLLRHGQLSVKVDERLLPLILLHTEDYHVAAAVAGDIDRLMGLAAKIRYLVGIVAQVGNRTNGRHDSHLLIGTV
jgi:hypothetical protein